MNHRKFGIKLGRNRREREALFKSLTKSMFTYGAIETTRAKARSVVPIIEKLANHIMTKDVVIVSRELAKYSQDNNFISSVYKTFKAAFEGQTSNFTKMHNVKIRQGDDALIVKFAFVKPYSLALAAPKADVKEEKKAVEKKVVAKKAPVKKVVKKVTKKVADKSEK